MYNMYDLIYLLRTFMYYYILISEKPIGVLSSFIVPFSNRYLNLGRWFVTHKKLISSHMGSTIDS